LISYWGSTAQDAEDAVGAARLCEQHIYHGESIADSLKQPARFATPIRLSFFQKL
jgi:hypothetical protein